MGKKTTEVVDPKAAYALVPEVKACWRELVKSSGESLKYAMQIGDLLIRMKPNLPHGEFQKTIEERFDFGYRAAANYMKLANELPSVIEKIGKPAAAEGLSVDGGLRLISSNKPKKRRPKVQTSALLAEHTDTAPSGPDEDGDDPNEHCREQINNEAATGDINKPPPDKRTDFDPSKLESQSPVKDGLGKDPPKELRDVFAIRDDFAKQRNALTQVKKWITQTVSHPGAKVLESVAQQIKVDIDNADRALKFARPHSACVYCKNKMPKLANCNACKGNGWITEPVYDQAPKDMK